MCVKWPSLFTVSRRDTIRVRLSILRYLIMRSLNNLFSIDVNRLSNRRKQKINMTDWKNVKHNTLRNSGKEYISQSKKLVPAKKPPTVVSKNVMNVVK